MEEGEISFESPPSRPVTDRQLLTQRVLLNVKPGSSPAEVLTLTEKIQSENKFKVSHSEVVEIVKYVCSV